jgi:drug/metabolite transporter (DMT)-like permease
LFLSIDILLTKWPFWRFLIPLCGALLSWLLLADESPGFWPVIGMVCIASAIVFFNLAGIRRLRPSR